MKLLYLDYNCFQRSFDDLKQVRIQLEAIACREIFKQALESRVTLIWSFVHTDENDKSPFLNIKNEVLFLSGLCGIQVGVTNEIVRQASEFQKSHRIDAKDALHLACATEAQCQFFLTCDDRLIRRSRTLKKKFKVVNPACYLTGGFDDEGQSSQ